MHFQNLIIPVPRVSHLSTSSATEIHLMRLYPGGCTLLFNLHLILNSSAMVQSPTHIIIHLFPRYSRGIYQRDMEGSIYQRIYHVRRENPVTTKARKNKKALITWLALSEWMDCSCWWGESPHHSRWVPISHWWRLVTGSNFSFFPSVLVLKMPRRQEKKGQRAGLRSRAECYFNWCLRNKSQWET